MNKGPHVAASKRLRGVLGGNGRGKASDRLPFAVLSASSQLLAWGAPPSSLLTKTARSCCLRNWRGLARPASMASNQPTTTSERDDNSADSTTYKRQLDQAAKDANAKPEAKPGDAHHPIVEKGTVV
ncbi:hypothetical protein MAPG_03978 [Magnaporthiopsis poae ATCC 64411]|uniref:Uncharacterized protein n=1 Tax=Magnaporthiopsis poae (strain ATCC 64411 / 73-15) TaxID=644358 RepID=A0A0C4DVH4_MAGP6|nr:hypothetical protein MAPG_03978 [Magnaporthiopsis poae ATCC 64411]